MSRNIEDWTKEALAARCEVVEDGIVRMREVPGGKATTFGELLAIANDLGKPFGEWVVIIDLAEATRPSPRLIEGMPRFFRSGAKHYIVHLHTSNRVMVGVGDFVMRRLPNFPVTIRNTAEDALAAARQALAGELVD